MSYTHLSARERMGLFYMHQYGYSIREIARRLDRSHTTLSRELKRNARPLEQGYCDHFAHHLANSHDIRNDTWIVNYTAMGIAN
jgi:IS30 family transposase